MCKHVRMRVCARMYKCMCLVCVSVFVNVCAFVFMCVYYVIGKDHFL